MGKTTEVKSHWVNLRSPLLRIYYYQNKRLQVKESQYVTNQSDAHIPVCGLLHCMNLSMWLNPQQPFDCCSWFAAASHRNINKIFNAGARDFAWLQNPKAYKKCSKNSFFCRRRLGFQKENLMKLSRVRFFFFHLLLNRSLMGSPIPNRFTQTLGFPSPIRIIQTHKQIAF